jgi:rubrerythrin
MKTRDIEKGIADQLRQWQKVEDRTVSITGQAIEKTENPILRLVMEIIQRDSQAHHRVQQFLLDELEGKPVTLTPEHLGEISQLVERHMQAENEMTQNVEAALAAIKGRKLLVLEYFLNYLREDECKHAAMLSALDTFKRGIYPYA